jgi:hypothetical protein
MLIRAGRLHVHVGDVAEVQFLLGQRHLPLLPKVPVGGVKASEGLHRQEEDQLEVWHTAGRLLAFQRQDECISGSHCFFGNDIKSSKWAGDTSPISVTR